MTMMIGRIREAHSDEQVLHEGREQQYLVFRPVFARTSDMVWLFEEADTSIEGKIKKQVKALVFWLLK